MKRDPLQTAYSIGSLPIRPLGLMADQHKKFLRGVGPLATGLGDIGTQIAGPALAQFGNDAATGVAKLTGAGLTAAAPGLGAGAGELASKGVDFLSALAGPAGLPTAVGSEVGAKVNDAVAGIAGGMGGALTNHFSDIGNIAGKLAIPAAQAAGRLGYAGAMGGADVMSKLGGVFPKNPHTEGALDAYAAMQMAPHSMPSLGGAPQPDNVGAFTGTGNENDPRFVGPSRTLMNPPEPKMQDAADDFAAGAPSMHPDYAGPNMGKINETMNKAIGQSGSNTLMPHAMPAPGQSPLQDPEAQQRALLRRSRAAVPGMNP